MVAGSAGADGVSPATGAAVGVGCATPIAVDVDAAAVTGDAPGVELGSAGAQARSNAATKSNGTVRRRNALAGIRLEFPCLSMDRLFFIVFLCRPYGPRRSALQASLEPSFDVGQDDVSIQIVKQLVVAAFVLVPLFVGRGHVFVKDPAGLGAAELV